MTSKHRRITCRVTTAILAGMMRSDGPALASCALRPAERALAPTEIPA
jgi:hypothetical protein